MYLFDFRNNARLLRVDAVKGCAHRRVQARRLAHAHAQLCGKWSESSKVGRGINQQESDLNAFLF